MKRVRPVLPAIFAFAILVATSSCMKLKPTEDFDEGSIDVATSTYSNKYLGFTLSIPKTWLVQDSETQKMLAESGKKMTTGNNKALESSYDRSMENNHMLLTLFRHPVNQVNDFNASFIVNAERITPGLRIQRGSDYIEETRKTMSKGAVQIPFKDSGSENLGGVVFDKAEASYPIGKVNIKQAIYATVRKGYALAIIATYVVDEDGTTIDDTVKSIKFK